ncbi:MAG: FAD binding domain-containing protein, partial [Roseiflexus sp.]|nr:FAD binding domain-containing protein [Roseiflexus sp.]
MIPAPFQYYAAKTVNEAIGLLQQHGEDAKLLAGGHSLLPALKLRLAQPAVLIDISRV